MEAAKLEIGLPGKLFDQNFKMAGCLLTDCWVKHLWGRLKPLLMGVDEHMPNLQL
jgi:hypothetical protein